MKKYIILGVLILFIGTMVIVPMLKKDDDASFIPAEFTFRENLAVHWNGKAKIGIKVNSDEIQKLELIYNDSVFKTWENPKEGELTFLFDAGRYGLGTKPVSLVSTLKNGETRNDDRFVRVLSDITPQIWFAKVAATYPHETGSYTQGLEFSNGILYEGTGQYGQSMVGQVDLASGKIAADKHIKLDENYFGEGITVFGDKVYQITWKEQKCFVYNKNTMQLLKDISYTGEGWGLCNDGKLLIMSDGTERITFRNPETFAIERVIEVYDDQQAYININELEYIEGKIYANIWQTNQAIVIDPENGKVIAVIDGSELEKEGKGMGDVMNGIAYNPQNKKTYFTGKNWEKLFEVRLEKPNL